MKKLIIFVLVICITASSFVVIHADNVEETYLSDLRIVYADNFKDAQKALKGTEFEEYQLFNANLNKGTGEVGVWLAYKTTTDVEDAITDLSVIQMGAGYRDGNYQKMLEESRREYEAMGEIYLDAIDYFIDAYDNGDFLAECAYRQLNFYYDEDSDMTLGDLFLRGIGADGLATIFLEGNLYALANIRSLLAQGVSYNESGLTYLELVSQFAAEFVASGEDTELPDGENPDELALLIAATLVNLGKSFLELEAVEAELNYEDEDLTQLEINYMETMALATMLRDVDYLNGESLYDFCTSYELDENDITCLYPLVSALNDGQRALTQVFHYYDVLRYSMSAYPEEYIIEEIENAEAVYGKAPFSIYAGVDRSIFDGTFAVTNAAYRAEGYSDKTLFQFFFNEEVNAWRLYDIIICGAGIGFLSYAIVNSVSAARAMKRISNTIYDTFANGITSSDLLPMTMTNEDFLNLLIDQYKIDVTGAKTFAEKFSYVSNQFEIGALKFSAAHETAFAEVSQDFIMAQDTLKTMQSEEMARRSKETVFGTMTPGMVSAVMYVASGIMLLYTAINLLVNLYCYYNPDYDDIPAAMVDCLSTIDGDRYIKYDAVTMIDETDDGQYYPADLNAFEAQRWNALYYTKSYEAGKPLLATFSISYNNNAAPDGYFPVHRFGEKVCFDLNKHNFDSDSARIYLSVKQSDNQKSAVADVPPVVGSMLSTEYIFLSAGCGMLVGAGLLLLAHKAYIKKKKTVRP